MYSINCKGKLLTFQNPLVMGIINATPDSFYKGHLQYGAEGIMALAGKMIDEGAAILDIGGQSTRPGSDFITPDEEMKRVIPAIELITKNFPDSFISIDTFYSLVAKEAVAVGACIVNDISAGAMDEEMEHMGLL